jgi:hypothetical protein
MAPGEAPLSHFETGCSAMDSAAAFCLPLRETAFCPPRSAQRALPALPKRRPVRTSQHALFRAMPARPAPKPACHTHFSTHDASALPTLSARQADRPRTPVGAPSAARSTAIHRPNSATLTLSTRFHFALPPSSAPTHSPARRPFCPGAPSRRATHSHPRRLQNLQRLSRYPRCLRC